MKTIKILSLIFATSLTILSCGGGDDDNITPQPQPPTPEQPKGKHLTQQCDMPADASEIIIALRGLSSEARHVGGVARWLTTTLQPYSGGTPQVKVACQQNLNVDTRQQDITFIATNDTLVLTVRQAAYTGGGTNVNTPNDTYTDQPAYSRQK